MGLDPLRRWLDKAGKHSLGRAVVCHPKAEKPAISNH
jgi:hypothetical protein